MTGGLDLRRLEVFLAVADAGGIAAAARRLHLDPSAVSRLVGALERELGATLLTRSRSGTTLTPAGQLLADEGRILLKDAALIAARLAHAAGGDHPRLRMGLPSELPGGLLSAALPVLHPAVAVEIVEAGSAEQLDGLRRHELDIALIREPPPDDLVTVAVLDEPLGVLLPADHRALADDDPVDLARLGVNRWLSFARDHAPHYHDRLAAHCRAAGLHVVEGSDHLVSKAHMIAAGLGVSFAPRARAVALADLGVGWRPVTRTLVRHTYLVRPASVPPHVAQVTAALADAVARAVDAAR